MNANPSELGQCAKIPLLVTIFSILHYCGPFVQITMVVVIFGYFLTSTYQLWLRPVCENCYVCRLYCFKCKYPWIPFVCQNYYVCRLCFVPPTYVVVWSKSLWSWLCLDVFLYASVFYGLIIDDVPIFFVHRCFHSDDYLRLDACQSIFPRTSEGGMFSWAHTRIPLSSLMVGSLAGERPIVIDPIPLKEWRKSSLWRCQKLRCNCCTNALPKSNRASMLSSMTKKAPRGRRRRCCWKRAQVARRCARWTDRQWS